jgi:nucleoside-diphosphate-sugar epimerase
LPARIETAESVLEAGPLARAAARSSVLVHTAGLTRAPSESALRAVNVTGTEAAVTAANMVGARLIHISSQAVIGVGTRQQPSREDDAPRPLNAYGRSKLAAEAVVAANARLPWTILRPSAVYGPRDRSFLPVFRLASRGWFPLAADPSTAFTFLYVEDFARAVLAAATATTSAGKAGGPGQGSGAGGNTLFVGHPESQTTDDLLRCLAAVFQRTYRPRRVPPALVGALALSGELLWRIGIEPLIDRGRLAELRAAGFVCAVDRARDTIGFTATVGLSEGVERTAQWYRSQGWV